MFQIALAVLLAVANPQEVPRVGPRNPIFWMHVEAGVKTPRWVLLGIGDGKAARALLNAHVSLMATPPLVFPERYAKLAVLLLQKAEQEWVGLSVNKPDYET
jgi:hypothetical protein